MYYRLSKLCHIISQHNLHYFPWSLGQYHSYNHRERTQKELQLWHFKGTTFVGVLIKLAVLTLPRDRNIPCVEFRQRGCTCPVGLSSHCFVGNAMVIRLYTCTTWIMSAVNVRVVYKRKFSSGKITVFKDLVWSCESLRVNPTITIGKLNSWRTKSTISLASRMEQTAKIPFLVND